MILAYISMTILAIFVVEQMVMLYAKGMAYITCKWHVMDFCVILTSLVLEIVLSKLHVAGVLVVARVWRFARTGHGVREYNHKSHTLHSEFNPGDNGHGHGHGHSHDAPSKGTGAAHGHDAH